MYDMCSTFSQQHVVDVLAAPSLGTCSASAAQHIYSAKSKYINIVIYISLPIPPRFVMTEILFVVQFLFVLFIIEKLIFLIFGMYYDTVCPKCCAIDRCIFPSTLNMQEEKVFYHRKYVTHSVKPRLKSQNLIMRKQASKFDLYH